MQITSGQESWLCSHNGSRFSQYFTFITLSDNGNSKYINENCFIENLAASKQYVGTEANNAIINNIGYVHFACSEEELPYHANI